MDDLEKIRKADIELLNIATQRAHKLETNIFSMKTQIKEIDFRIGFFVFLHVIEVFFISYIFFR